MDHTTNIEPESLEFKLKDKALRVANDILQEIVNDSELQYTATIVVAVVVVVAAAVVVVAAVAKV